MTSEFNGETTEQWIKVSAEYLSAAVAHLMKDGRTRAMCVDTTITDSDGSHAVHRVNVDPQGKNGSMTLSNEMQHLSDGELMLICGIALAMFSEAASYLWGGAPQDDGDGTGREE